MKTYKGMDKKMQCQGFQFEVGGEYEESEIEMCNRGFHACENPIDVFSYYVPNGQNRFFEVEQSGKTITGDEKTVSQEIKIIVELSLTEFFKKGIELFVKKIKAAKTTINTAGDRSHANTAGCGSHANTAGDESISCAIGIHSKVKSKKGWIVLVDWRQINNEWTIHDIHHCKTGDELQGVIIKADCWYWFEGGKLNEE